MPSIGFVSSNFPAGVLANGPATCVCSWADLVWAAITVGKREMYDLVRHGQFSMFEIVYRATMLYANLREADDTSLVRSAVYKGLDPSEKAATSYFMGLTTAKLFAEMYLNVPWLMHLDVYRDRVHAVLTGRSRPDLIGLNHRDEWVVIESKGRTGEHDSDALAKAKEQAEQILNIGGAVPVLRVGLLAHFSGGVLGVEWDDPERKSSKEDVTVELSKEEFDVGYYRPFDALIRENRDRVEEREIGGELYEMVQLESADLRVGLSGREEREGAAGEYRRARQRRPRLHAEGRTAVGGDGVIVELGPSWDPENMRREPQARSRLGVGNI